MVNSGSGSRCDVGEEIVKILKKTEVRILPVSSACFPLSAPRARSEVMRNAKLEMLGGIRLRSWRDALREYLTTELAVSTTDLK
jgi:dTDP-4-dehydrorhamnose reductase